MNITLAQRQIAQVTWPAITTETRIDYVPPPPPEWAKARPPTPDYSPLQETHVPMRLFTIEAKDIMMGYCPQYDILLISDHIIPKQ